jgi:plasmid stabilization system protein ParE
VTHRVVFAPEAEEQLAALYRYIASASSTDIADRFTEAIVQFCESLSTFPERGNKRDDVRPNLRVTHYRKRVVVAFVVDAWIFRP